MEGPRGAAGGRSRRPACLVRYQQVTQCQPSLGCGRTSPSRRGVVSPLFPLSFPWGDGLLFVQARVKIRSDAATVSDLVSLFFPRRVWSARDRRAGSKSLSMERSL